MAMKGMHMTEQVHDSKHVEGLLTSTNEQVTKDILSKTLKISLWFKVVCFILFILVILGIFGFVSKLNLGDAGVKDHTKWGYLSAVFAYLLTVFQGAPIIAIAMRAIKAEWRRPLTRAAELFSIVGLVSLVLYIPLMLALPSVEGRRTLWITWHGNSPHIYDTLAMVGLVLCGLALLYFSSVPDLSLVGKKTKSLRGKFCSWISRYWKGTPGQWRIQKAGIGILGGMYFMFYVFVHLLISSDFAMSYVPGWKDSIFPAWHALSGIQSGIALVMVTMFLMRTIGGYKDYLFVNQFWSLSKLLLALSLLWFYFWAMGFMVFWYGRMPIELTVLKGMFFVDYRIPFSLAFILCFVAPFFILVWNGFRKSILGPTIAAVLVLIGNFFDRIRIYVSTLSIKDITVFELDQFPPIVLPIYQDILMMVGALAGALLIYLLISRVVPLISIWETKEGLLYQFVGKVLRGRYLTLAKPE